MNVIPKQNDESFLIDEQIVSSEPANSISSKNVLKYRRDHDEFIYNADSSLENEEPLKLAVAQAGIGVWDLYPLTGKLYLSNESKQIFGLPNNIDLDYTAFKDNIYPEDRLIVESGIQSALDPSRSDQYNAKYRILRFNDKSIRWIKASGKVYFNSDRKAVRFLGTIIDITDQIIKEDKNDIIKLQKDFVEKILDSSLDQICVYDKEMKFLAANKKFIDISGVDAGNILGKTIIDIFPSLENSSIHNALRRTINENITETFAWISPDTSRYYSISSIPLALDNDVYAAIISAHDITELFRTTQKLQESNYELERKNLLLLKSEERYQKMIEEVEDYAIILLDLKGNIQNWNQGAQKIKGYNTKEIIGRNFSVFHDDADRKNDLASRLIEEATTAGKAVHEGWRVRKNGSKFWGNTVLTALHDENNTVIGFTKVTRDLTDKKNKEDALKQFAQEVIKKNEELRQEKEFIETVLDSSVDLITVYDVDTRIITINKQVEDLLGVRREHIIGKKFKAVFSNETSSQTYDYLLRAIKGENIHYVHPLGAMGHSFDIYMVPIKHKEKVNAVLVLTHDITNLIEMSEKLQTTNSVLEDRNLKLSERNDELQQQKELIETIIDTSVDFIGVYDKEMRLISINKKSLSIMKKQKEDVIGKTFEELNVGNPGAKEVFKDLQKAMNGESIHRVYPRSAESFGRDYEIFYIPLAHNNVIYATLTMVHDITDIMNISEKLRLTNAKLEEKNIELERSNRELEQFAYVASHDLQEPLRKIMTFTGRIEERVLGVIDDTSASYFKKIVNSSNRMSDLIKDVLNFSRLTSGKFSFEQTDLNQIMKQLINDFDLIIEEKGAIISWNDLPEIDAIPYQMEQLFHNLLSNSLKFSKNGLKPIVEISSTEVPPKEIINRKLDQNLLYKKISFQDNGIGFDQEFAERIFIIFQRLNGRQDFTGTGIGLALCRKIVDIHGGQIEAKSRENEGATFSIILPVHQSIKEGTGRLNSDSLN